MADSLKIIPGRLFIVKEYEPAQRLVYKRVWWPFIGLIDRRIPLWLLTFSIAYMKTRSFHAVRVLGRIIYLRRLGA